MTFIDTVLRIVLGLVGWGFTFLAGTANGFLAYMDPTHNEFSMRATMWVLAAASCIHIILLAVL